MFKDAHLKLLAEIGQALNSERKISALLMLNERGECTAHQICESSGLEKAKKDMGKLEKLGWVSKRKTMTHPLVLEEVYSLTNRGRRLFSAIKAIIGREIDILKADLLERMQMVDEGGEGYSILSALHRVGGIAQREDLIRKTAVSDIVLRGLIWKGLISINTEWDGTNFRQYLELTPVGKLILEAEPSQAKKIFQCLKGKVVSVILKDETIIIGKFESWKDILVIKDCVVKKLNRVYHQGKVKIHDSEIADTRFHKDAQDLERAKEFLKKR